MTDPQTSAKATGAAAVNSELAAALPNGQQVYDALMGDIEPELTSTDLQTLDEKYADETPEEKSTRMERYQRAFEAYDRAYEAWIEHLTDLIEKQRTIACREAEVRVMKEEKEELAALERTFDEPDATPPQPPTPQIAA